MKHPTIALLAIAALLAPVTQAADPDVTGLVPTIWFDFETKPSVSGLAKANKGSASISFSNKGTAAYGTGVTNGWALNTVDFRPYSGSGSYSSAGKAFTVSAVMTLGTTANGVTLSVRCETAQTDLIIRRGATAGSLVVGLGTQNVASTAFLNATMEDGDTDFHLVSVVAEQSSTSLYVDGVLVTNTTEFSLLPAYGGVRRMQFGERLTANVSPEVTGGGLVDDLRIHNAALTPGQMAAIASEYGLLETGFIDLARRGEPTVGKNSFSVPLSLILGEGTANASIVYGADAALSTPTTNVIGSAIPVGDYTASLSGLAPGTTYWWKIVASNGVNWAETSVASFHTPDVVDVSAFAYRIPITISGYDANRPPLTNFPVLVRLAANAPFGFDYANCAANGADLRFSATDGTLFPHEIDTWDTNGVSLVWVGIPILTNNASFKMYYGSGDPGPTSAANLWELAGYAGVWHLTDGHDSTSNGLDGTIVSGISTTTVSMIGGALDFNNAKMGVGTTPNFNLASGFSLEAWCYPHRLADKNGKNGNGFFGKNLAMSVRIEQSNIRLTTPGVKDHDYANCNIVINEWFHLGITFLPKLTAANDSNTVANQYKVYRDGVQKASLGASRIPNLNSAGEMWIGGNQWSDQNFNGILDELRLSYSIRSADWIKAAYDAAVAPAEFAVLGAVESTDDDIPRIGAMSALDENGTATFTVELSLPGYGGEVPTSVSVFYGTDGEHWTELPLGSTNAAATLTGAASGLAGEATVLWYATATATQGVATKTATSPQLSFVTKALEPVGHYKHFSAEVNWNGAPVENIPVLLRLSETAVFGFDYRDVTDSGFEILDASGHQLPYEIDTWNTNGESLVWVLLPDYRDGASFTVRYGTTFSNPPLPASDVWADYVAVWHMNEILEDPATGQHYTPDSSASGWHAYKTVEADAVPAPVTTAPGAPAHPTPLTGTAMNISYGAGKKATDSGGFIVPADVTSSTTLDGPGFTLSAIVNSQQDGNDSRCRVIAFGNAYNDMANFAVGKDRVFCMGAENHSKYHTSGATNWVCATDVFGSPSYIYVDGVNLSGANGGKPNLSSLTLEKGVGLGCFTDGKQCLNGYIDEARIRNAASTADRIAAEYHAITDNAVLAYGTVASSDTTAPVLGMPSVARNSNGSFTVSVEVSGNLPVSVSCTIAGADYAMTTADAAVPAMYSATVSYLPDGTHMASVRASSESGTTVYATCPTAFHTGALTVEVISNADEGLLAPGVFRVSRLDADPTGLPALTFDVAFSGDGLAAVIPPAVSALTIPAGESSVDVSVTPINTTDVNVDTEVVLTASGTNIGQPSSNTMAVVNADYDIAVRYVATTGDDANHGGTPELAKKTIASAISSLSNVALSQTCTVHVAEGRYTISSRFELKLPIRLIGDDADPSRVVVSNTHVAASGKHYGCVAVNHMGAIVSGMTFENGKDADNGGNVLINSNGGMVTNCILRNGYTRDGSDSGGANVAIRGPGLVTHCLILGGFEDNCSGGDRVSSVYLDHANARIENCLVDGFQGATASTQPTTTCGGIVVNKGEAVNCTVVNCTSPYTEASGFAGILVWSSGQAVNCVSAGNVDSNGTVRAFAAAEVSRTSHCAFDAIVGETAVPGDMPDAVSGTLASFFRNFAAGDYRPKTGGPLVGVGENYSGMADVDLTGTHKRLVGRIIDIGAYEGDPEMTIFIVK